MADFEQEHIGSVAMGDSSSDDMVERIAISMHYADGDPATVKWAKQPGKYRASLRRDVRDVLSAMDRLGISQASAALSRPAQEPVAVKPLEWIGNEARSSLGVLYSVQQLSPNVWTTYMNGTAFPGWKAQRSSAVAIAQDNDERRQRAAPQPAHGTSASDPAPSQISRVRHKKRGSEYEVIGVGKMQTEDWMIREYCGADEPVNGATVDMAEVAIYRSVDDGSLWVRPVKEFNDGRFEVLTMEGSKS